MATEITGMVEKRGMGLWLTHVAMIAGVLVIFFPIWLAFVASTVSQPEIVRPPMPVWPGDKFIENYTAALVSGVQVLVILNFVILNSKVTPLMHPFWLFCPIDREF